MKITIEIENAVEIQACLHAVQSTCSRMEAEQSIASRCSAATERVHEPAASQDGNNAMVIAAVQAACNDIADKISEAIIADEFCVLMGDDEIRQRVRNVVQTIQRRYASH